tara:strand:- start:664 stop:1065 length:402 start_codon:yes stop_codon:yes gene_type:complete
MRLSKRQLKRIIREEYSRLKRRGLIKEQVTDFMSMGAPYDTDLFADFCDAADSLHDDDPSWTTNTLGYLWEEAIEEMLDEDGNYHVEELFSSNDAYGVCPSLVKLAMDNGSSPGNVEFLMKKFLKFAADEQGY